MIKWQSWVIAVISLLALGIFTLLQVPVRWLLRWINPDMSGY